MPASVKRSIAPLVLAATAMIAGCDSQPSGQVVAKVNGEEITQQELDAAIGALGAPPDADRQKVRKAALDQLIDLELLVQKAKQMGLDKTPEYLLASRLADDKILSELLARRLAGNLRVPLGSEVDDFVRDNPKRFAQREVFTVDQVRTAGPVLNSAWLPTLPTLAAVIQELQRRNIPYVTTRTLLDTSDWNPTLYAKMAAVPPGRPFAVQVGTQAVISVIVSREQKPLDADQSRQVASGILQRRNTEASLRNAVAAYRRDATIEYAPPPGAAPSAK